MGCHPDRVLAVKSSAGKTSLDLMQNKLTVTIPQACELTGLGRSTLYRLFEDGKLQRLKSGTRTLIKVADLEAYIESLCDGQA